ncbi:hypothetical protein [Rhizobium leguminosarum]|uniref:hypothetical protein n=1 Tax=Rhizobium leguminosarum TaxID=384 RepID=UPI001C981363|nr:hypothetical protein [Rhizobium leguminosarum]MBY5374219.1 hypothetical protein [Rhizobium leguminosarum]
MSTFRPGKRTVTDNSAAHEGAVVLDWSEHYARQVMKSLNGAGAPTIKTDGSPAKGSILDLAKARKDGGRLE